MIGKIFFSVTDFNLVYSFKIVSFDVKKSIPVISELVDEYKNSSDINFHFTHYNRKIYINETPSEKTYIFETKNEAVNFALRNIREKIEFQEKLLLDLEKTKDDLEKQLK